MLLFGHGGTAVEVINDRALALPPLNLHLARELMSRTRIHRLLEGYRDRPPADLDAIAATLVKISQLVVDIAEIASSTSTRCSPMAAGVIALDVRIRVAAAAGRAASASRSAPIRRSLRRRSARGRPRA